MRDVRLWWYRNDCSLWRNPKILRLMQERGGDRAVIVWQSLIAYSVEWDRNGVVPIAELPHAAPLARAVHVRLLIDHGYVSVVDDAYVIHDYDTYQRDTDKARQLSEAGKQANRVRWDRERRKRVRPIRDDEG